MLPRSGDHYLYRMQSHDGSVKEALRQKMLSQEYTFKKQVLELHRLYQIQVILMKNSRLKKVATTQSASCSFQGILQRPLDAEVSPSHCGKHSAQNKIDGWGTLENPVQVEYCFSAETESSLDEVKLSLGIGGDTVQKRSRLKFWDGKQSSIPSQYIIDLEESTDALFGRDIEAKSAPGCAASSADSRNLHDIQSRCSSPNGANKDFTTGINRSQSLIDGRKNCLPQSSLNQGTGISSATKVFTYHEAASIDLNKPPIDELHFSTKDLAMESSIGASCAISDTLFGELHKDPSLNGTSWRKPENNCTNEVSAIVQQDSLNVTVMASNSNDSSTNRSGSKLLCVDLESRFRSPSDHSEIQDCLAGNSQNEDAEFVSSLPNRNKGKTIIEVDEMMVEEDALSSHLCRNGDTIEYTDSSPASCKSDSVATDPSSSLKTMQSGTHFGKSDLSHMNSFHNSESSQDESSIQGESKPGSFDEKKEASANDDALIQKGAVSLLYFLLESSSRLQHDCIPEVDKMNDIENEKRDQPQCSLDSFESMVLKIEESNVEGSCVSSNPVEVNDMDKKDYGIKLRRGRRLKDFQKDILPGLSSLARHEICEDIRIMEGVIRSREYKKLQSKMSSRPNWFSPVRSRRSRLNYIGRKYY
ncbi:hypothetical protein ACH5RR_040191 [Cinchona calisaya]|uniref:Uncharacterized protein n=1 Tax=Cinchona calisaya TaxID=153742 RepID=A0ABD2XRL1_9GENT